ncbi:Radical SAM superfamily enzyme, MoaA/NifB/PqqE/SkfB family [Desulfacinum infernum DSM 9756]|uniref:Radical SAM superfamily enzyme, MoaA/NifB/PqqE/SkfB family n=1 Tax=Desulfacinum infernum DSM 9756 TaxID=1121391 RepID=A0A1M4TDD7_9BACT|nr:DUF5714 domain-containing protein [Desulfacinum infernum]SHE42522.1 Radical SAM superfamily enzyme, MoaA/NifB/PqqE/SkfB family [Desulfacinum infernum DSM 9756]
MPFDPREWVRMDWEATPIYVRPDPPCWFVPNETGDRLLQEALRKPDIPLSHDAARFWRRLPESSPSRYAGRAEILKPHRLKEFWIHLTDRCNLACLHCLFASSPTRARELPADRVLESARQAHELGCRLFALTGGEPFVHPHIHRILQGLLALPDAHVAVLTNGLAARSVLERLPWDPQRLHLQVSLDGLEESHDAVRGRGTFERTLRELRALSRMGIPFTLSMCPTRSNLADVPHMADAARDAGASNIHFMWYFVRGRAVSKEFVPPDELLDAVRCAAERAEDSGVSVDNVQSLASQVFSPPGTRYDGGGAAWESLALGPDGNLYPSAALVDVPELAVPWPRGLERAWKDSPVFEQIRRQTAARLEDPLRFILGGGDPDHSYLAAGRFVGADPYQDLYRNLALWLIARRAPQSVATTRPALRLKMGDILQSCGSGEHGVSFVHSNCLLALASPSSLSVVRDFYSDAAARPKLDILNPVTYPEEWTAHIPEQYRFRGYGCGSPVVDAALQEGETVVDLGCGSGVECFMAAKQVGPDGRVIGIDMLEAMLKRARAGARATAERLGYDNMTFLHSLLEDLPLDDHTADVVLSNCVLNLSGDKRRAFREIHRILRPGGRLVVSDVVCDEDPDPAIRNDPVLHGECIGGALTQRDLAGILEESGFRAVRFLKRFPYRTVRGHRFYSLTFEARKETAVDAVPVLYPGPFAAVQTFGGTVLTPGPIHRIPRWEVRILEDQLWILDDAGAVTNREGESCCACAAPDDQPAADPAPPTLRVPGPSGRKTGQSIPLRRRSGCMVCGEPLSYESSEALQTCIYCEGRFLSSARCVKDHFVCDACHSRDALAVIEHLCLSSTETDLIALMDKIRRHPAMPVHGPEHHALVPAVVVAAYRNAGAPVDEETIRSALRRGSRVPGGSCGFMGCCGAAVGVGIAFSILLEANPVKGPERRLAQQATQEALADIASLDAARCCQRDSWIALRKAAQLSGRILDRQLCADHTLKCRQQAKNRECSGARCPVLRSLNGRAGQGLSA